MQESTGTHTGGKWQDGTQRSENREREQKFMKTAAFSVQRQNCPGRHEDAQVHLRNAVPAACYPTRYLMPRGSAAEENAEFVPEKTYPETHLFYAPTPQSPFQA